MKKIAVMLHAFFCLLMVSCSQESISDSPLLGNPKYDAPDTWQGQLDYAATRFSATRTENDGLRLVKYAKIGEIESDIQQTEVINRILADDSYMASGTTDNVEILTIREIKDMYAEMGRENPFEQLGEQLQAMPLVGAELVELEWSLNGRTYPSLAIASNDRGGIVFENIGFMIADTESLPKASMARP